MLRQALLHLATAQHAVGDNGALHSYRRSLTLAQQAADGASEALIRLNIGLILTADGHRDEGLDYLYRSAAIASEVWPDGSDLERQAEEAIAQYAEQPLAETTHWSASDLSRGDYPFEPEYQGTYYEDDEIYTESTLPPH
jgi:hypothetical protein